MARRLAVCAVVVVLGMLAGDPSAAQLPAAPDSTAADSTGWFHSPTAIAMRSLVFPGWGQAASGSWVKALIVAAIEGAFIERLVFERGRVHHYREMAQTHPDEADFYRRKEERHKNHRRDFIWWTSFLVALSMGDAYVDAHLQRFDVQLQARPTAAEEAGGQYEYRLRLGLRMAF